MSLLFARYFCGICFFCLDVGCRRIVLRYRVNECVKYIFMDTVCVCVCVCAWYTGHAMVSPMSLLLAQLSEDCTLVQRWTGPFWMKVIVSVVENLGPSTPSILLDSVEQIFALGSRKWDLLRWRSFCDICFFCLDVGCRRVVLRYRVSGRGEWKCWSLSYSCQGLFGNYRNGVSCTLYG